MFICFLLEVDPSGGRDTSDLAGTANIQMGDLYDIEDVVDAKFAVREIQLPSGRIAARFTRKANRSMKTEKMK